MHLNQTDLIAIVRDHLPNLLDGLLTEALMALLRVGWQAWQRRRASKLQESKQPAALPEPTLHPS